MRQKGQFFISLVIIIILLPYVVTIFIHGTKGNGKDAGWEEYLLGELAEEISGASDPEAVKAQAVIARTKIYKKIAEGEKLEDLYVNPKDAEKRWGSSHYEEYYKKFKQAIQETKHQVLKYNGQLIDASYHQISTGNTRSASELGMGEEYNYLQAKECSHDKEADKFAKETIFTSEELSDKLGIEKDAVNSIKIKKEDSSGYALSVQVGDEVINGEEFSEKLNLPSAGMKLTYVNDDLVIMTKGIGHGLGLSQYAAEKMAEEGTGYRDILQYFYTDVEIADGGNTGNN